MDIASEKMKIVLAAVQVRWPRPFLGLANLKACALADPKVRDGTDIVILDCAYRTEADVPSLVDRIQAQDPRVVGFTCFVWNWVGVAAVGRELKRRVPQVTIILGGPNVGDIDRETLRENEWADLVVRGEGEETFLELLAVWRGGGDGYRDVRGVTYREKGEIRRTEDRPPLEDLGRIPSPYLMNLIDLRTVNTVVNYVEVSRGCPYGCRYCQHGSRQTLRYFPVEKIRQEMDYIVRRRGKGSLQLLDTNPFQGAEVLRRVMDHFHELAKGKNIVCELNGNVVHLKEGMVGSLDSPKVLLAFGVQSTDGEVLKAIDRQFDLERVETNLKKLQSLAPKAKIALQIMLGLPKDTPRSFLHTLDWCLSLHVDQITVYRTFLLPGTGLWNERESLGLKYDPSLLNQILETPTFSDIEMNRMQELATDIVLLRTMPLVRDLLWSYGELLKGTVDGAQVHVHRAFMGWLRDHDGTLRGRLDRGRSMEWSRRGLFWDNEFTLEKEERVAVLKGLAAYLKEVGRDHDLPRADDLENRTGDEIRRYEWLANLSGYMRKLDGKIAGVRDALLLGSDIVGVVEELNGEGWGLRGIDVTKRPYYSIRQLTLSREWDKVRVASYEELREMRNEGVRSVVLERMWNTLNGDERAEQTLRGLMEGMESITFLDEAAADPSDGGRLGRLLERMGYVESGRHEVGDIGSEKIAAKCWRKVSP